MNEIDEDQYLRRYNEISARSEAEVKRYFLSLEERFKDSEADKASDLRYLDERLKEDEHELQESVCPTRGQPFSKHGEAEIQAPQEAVNPSNPSALAQPET
jgi:hypothetical protein